MSDAIIKVMVFLFAGILSIYPLIELLLKKKKAWIKVLIIIFLATFWYVMIKYNVIIERDTRQANQHVATSDSLVKESQKELNELKSKADLTNEYLRKIKDSLKAGTSNKEIINNIDKVETLNQ